MVLYFAGVSNVSGRTPAANPTNTKVTLLLETQEEYNIYRF